MRAFLVLGLIGLLTLAADAAPGGERSFSLAPAAESVEVVARGVVAAPGATIRVTRERLEIPIDDRARVDRQSYGDPTVRRVEVRGRAPRVLSIKLRHDGARVAALAATARFVQVGEELHVIIPRTPAPAPVPASTAPESARSAVAAAPTPTPTGADEPAMIGAATPSELPPSELRPAVEPSPPATGTAKASIAGARAGGSGRWWIVLVGLGLVGGGAALVLRRRRASPSTSTDLEILASRSLGGKARVIWLSVGGRELVVAVTPQQVRPLGQWRAGERSARTFASAFDDAVADAPGGAASRPVAASPAVSGLLRLRERLPSASSVSAEVATGDEDLDAQWARDLVSATGGRR